MEERVKVAEAARLLGVSQQFVRIGMQRNRLPIGTAVKMSTKWTYHISRERLETYLSGEDIINGVAATTERTNYVGTDGITGGSWESH